MSVTELVSKFYKSEAIAKHQIIEAYLHDELQVFWHSREGYLHLDKNDLMNYALNLEQAYSASRFDITHLLNDGENVTIRYTHFVTPIENPDQELILAHFMAIWEIKDQKLFKGYVMSQL